MNTAKLSPRIVLAVVTALAAFPLVTQAQTFLSRPAGSTANTVDRPAPNTPIPAYYEESYNAYLKMKADAKGGITYTKATYGKMPDWSGVWSRSGAGGLSFDSTQKRGELAPAKLTPRYQAAYEAKLAAVKEGNEWDQLSDCLPSGYPRFLTEPFLREFVVTPDQTWWTNEQQSEVRRIYTDGRGHVPEETAAGPLWTGDSIGFWDGDTLVVHTIRVTHGEYQRSQPDYSDKLSTVERIRLVKPDTIQDDVTVWDPHGLREPWKVSFTYARRNDRGGRIDLWSCNANNNVVRTPQDGSQFILAGESVQTTVQYKDPDTYYLTGIQKKLFEADENDKVREGLTSGTVK